MTSVVANGVIHARGRDVVLSDTRDRFVFPGGSITITHERSGGTDRYDPVTCTFRGTETGTYQIVNGGGIYDDARGQGTYVARIIAVGCAPNNPRQSSFRVNLEGTIRGV